MTREEQRKIKAAKKEAKLAVKEAIKQEKKDAQAWDKMIKMAKLKNAFIQEPISE